MANEPVELPVPSQSFEFAESAAQRPIPGDVDAQRPSDSQLLKTVHELVQTAKNKKAVLVELQNDSRLTGAKSAHQTAKEKKITIEGYLAQTQIKLTAATTKAATANGKQKAKFTDAQREMFAKDLAHQQAAHQANKNKLAEADVGVNTAANEVSRLEEALLGGARAAASAAQEALDHGLTSLASQIDVEHLSVPDIALLSGLDAQAALTAEFKEKISREVSTRFDNASLETLDAIAQAYRDGVSAPALARIVAGMKPEPWSVLFMLVQKQQGGQALSSGDEFIGKLIGKIENMDLASMEGLNSLVHTDEMKPTASAIYVSALDAAIPKSVMNTVNLDDEAFELLSSKFIAHKDAWPRLHAPEAGREKPYFANLTTAELSSLFTALDGEKRWSDSAAARAVVEDVRSRFHECLAATSENTPREDLEALARTAKSTSYVEKLPLADVRALFQALQRSSKAWLREPSEAMVDFVAQINTRFLREYLPSITPATDPAEMQELATGFQGFAQLWKRDVQQALPVRGQSAEQSTAFGTLNTDEVGDLFLKIHKVGVAWPSAADEFLEAVASKLGACYTQVQLTTHEMLVHAHEQMTPAGQLSFQRMVNRAPEQLAPLLKQVFGTLPTHAAYPKVPSKEADASSDVLRNFQAAIEYRTKLPGANKSPEAISDWLTQALPAVGGLEAIALWANMPGAFRTAWLANGDQHQYFNAAAKVAEDMAVLQDKKKGESEQSAALKPQNKLWPKYFRLGLNASFFAERERPWTPALQKHMESLYRRMPDADRKECKFDLQVLKTYQTIAHARSGISDFDAKVMLAKLQWKSLETRQNLDLIANLKKEILDHSRASASKTDRAAALLNILEEPRDMAEHRLIGHANEATPPN